MTAAAIGGCSTDSSSSDSTSTAASTEDSSAADGTEDSTDKPDSESSSEADSETDGSGEAEVHTSKNGIETRDNGVVRTELTALELSYLMGNGINLGNTMEACDHNKLPYGKDPSFYETNWGQPLTTQEMITGMHEAGFDTIRIPVAWVTNTMNYEEGDYTITESYLDRVEEIMNYALNEDMYVIINDHWDGGWWGMFGSATEETREEAMKLYTSMWTQIAERYAEYGDHLIFESGNEEIGTRLNDKDIAADSGTLSEDECYETSALINQTFVDTIRSTGGNNENRFLLIAGYNTDIEKTCDDRFQMPEDTADSKLLVSVHYYNPWNYTGDDTTVNQWGTQKEYQDQNELLAMMSKYTEQGYGVVLGEYAVIPIDGEQRNNTVDFIGNFLDNCDYYNYCPVLWDCSSLYSRTDGKMKFDDTAELFSTRSVAAQSSMTQKEEQDAAKARMDENLENAPATFGNSQFTPGDTSTAIGSIMWNSGDWALTYNVGDDYAPDSISSGVAVNEVEVTGEGTYTVGLDFTEAGGSNGTVFSAVAVYNGEILYPGYIMEITSVLIDGEEYEFIARPYTTNDNETTTRVNLYNSYVNKIPAEARTIDGDLEDANPCVVDNNIQVNTIEITFDYVAPENAESYVADRDAWAAGLE